MPTGSTSPAAIYRQLIVKIRLETRQRPYPNPHPGLIEYFAMSSFTTNAGAYAAAGVLSVLHTCRFPIKRPSACGAPHDKTLRCIPRVNYQVFFLASVDTFVLAALFALQRAHSTNHAAVPLWSSLSKLLPLVQCSLWIVLYPVARSAFGVRPKVVRRYCSELFAVVAAPRKCANYLSSRPARIRKPTSSLFPPRSCSNASTIKDVWAAAYEPLRPYDTAQREPQRLGVTLIQCQIGETKSCHALFSPKTMPLICFFQNHSGSLLESRRWSFAPIVSLYTPPTSRGPVHFTTTFRTLISGLCGVGPWQHHPLFQRVPRQPSGPKAYTAFHPIHHATTGASNVKSQTLFRCVSDTGSISLCLHGLIARKDRFPHVFFGGPRPAGMVLFL